MKVKDWDLVGWRVEYMVFYAYGILNYAAVVNCCLFLCVNRAFSYGIVDILHQVLLHLRHLDPRPRFLRIVKAYGSCLYQGPRCVYSTVL